ncbi:MAG: hypothetical protein ACTSRC_21995 [Candidatus Helarchaeota archaeon]
MNNQKLDKWRKECKEILEYEGYLITAGEYSLKLFDFIAIVPIDVLSGGPIKCIKCSYGDLFDSEEEKKEYKHFCINNPNLNIEIWYKTDRDKIKVFIFHKGECIEMEYIGAFVRGARKEMRREKMREKGWAEK